MVKETNRLMNFLRKLFGKTKVQSTYGKSNKSDEELNALHNRVQEAVDLLYKFKRTAWVPELKSPASPVFSAKSKFGGYPYLRHENDWPVCPGCQRNMQLFLQLDLGEIPINVEEEILLQLFYCTSDDPHCESDLEAFFPFSKGSVCRRVKKEGKPVPIKPNLQNVFQERLIVDWDEADDYPHPEEYASLGIPEFDDDLSDALFHDDICTTLLGDKLGGWPSWVQYEEYPHDRKTGKRMELFFQVDSEHGVPYMFGDVGVAHITQSPDNKDELGFGWACH